MSVQTMWNQSTTTCRLIAKPAIIALSFIMITGCNTPRATPPPPVETTWTLTKLLGVGAIQEWALTELIENSEAVSLIPNAKTTLSMPSVGKVTGTATVNRYNGEFTLYTEDRIKWTGQGFASTRMAGPADYMTQEMRFLNALRNTDHVTLTRRTITFANQAGSYRLTFARPPQ